MTSIGKHLYRAGLGTSAAIRDDLERYDSWREEASPYQCEVASLLDLDRADMVAEAFQAIDWSFSNDETGFLTHALHPYPSKFIPQIPGYCVELLSAPGELVLDPFGGSGTTALEAIRLGRRALSVDANPIGTLIGQVKTCNLDAESAIDLRAIRSSLMTWLVDLPGPERLCKRHRKYIPDIRNMDKWFPLTSRGELALIRSRIDKMDTTKGRMVALLALSRIVLPSSFQDSETRYTSRPREIPPAQTLKRYLFALEEVLDSVVTTQPEIRYGVCEFLTADAMNLAQSLGEPGSVDLIVTSPPYGNANDYHLYHRFRLLWLGYDPRDLRKIEIGSHLRHQKESSGFSSYMAEMERCLRGMFRVLRPGRYAVLVVGDAVYDKVLFPAAEAVIACAKEIGFQTVCTVERPIHGTRRSFAAAGRRATTESLIVLRKDHPKQTAAYFEAPPYRLWPYEERLRDREIEVLLGTELIHGDTGHLARMADTESWARARRLVFTHEVKSEIYSREWTWQAIVENGRNSLASSRKDPKYVTHGLHAYKGKFYPQLAKSLMNIGALSTGGSVYDPFCGSGTTLLECYLNGYKAFGCDRNPLAAKIAMAKVGILDVNPDVVREAVATLVTRIEDAPDDGGEGWEQFDPECLDEMENWFPDGVISKLNWLLRCIRAVSDGVVRDFLEIVVSSIVRDVSQQEPSDLRIRRRSLEITDAPVLELYLDALWKQYGRIEKFWSIRGYSPNTFERCHVVYGDSRDPRSLDSLGLGPGSVDLILTSPPYAMALPYIDTDRLSMLVLLGMDSVVRRPIELGLIGSREARRSTLKEMEQRIMGKEGELPEEVQRYLCDLLDRVSNADVGFRRKNMPALLLRFFEDMDRVIGMWGRVLRHNGEAIIVVGDNRMRIGEGFERIPTSDFIEAIAIQNGFRLIERIDISVTTENLIHIKNSITKNVVLRFATV